MRQHGDDDRGAVGRRVGRLAGFGAALVLTLSSGAGAQSLILETETLRPGGTLVFHYRFPFIAGSHRVEVLAPDSGFATGASVHPEHPEWTREEDLAGTIELEVDELVGAGYLRDTLAGITVRLLHTRPGVGEATVTRTRFATVVNDVVEQPGLLTVPGRRFGTDRRLVVGVRVPSMPEGYVPDRPRLVLFRPAAELPGGARVPGESKVVETLDNSGDVELRTPEIPGEYEVQLWDHNGFVLERVPITVDLDIPALDLRPSGPGPYAFGSPVSLDFDPVRFPRSLMRVLGTTWTPDGRGTWNRPGGPHSAEQRIDQSSGDDPRAGGSFGLETDVAGPAQFISSWDVYPTSFGRILGERYAYQVEPGPDTAASQYAATLTVPRGGIFHAGQPIDLAVGISNALVAGPVELRVHTLAPGVVQDVWSPLPGRPRWSRELDAPAVAPPPADLEPGDYTVQVLGNQRHVDGAPMVLAVGGFTLLPALDTAAIEVNGGAPVVAYRPYTAEVTMPPGIAADDPRVAVHFVHLGGDLPGCHTLLEKTVHMHRMEDGETSFTISGWSPDGGPPPLVAPGEYEARLYFGAADARAEDGADVEPLAFAPFEVIYEPAPGALRPPGGETYVAGDPVAVSVELPAGLSGSFENGWLKLRAMRLGEVAASGAVRYPFDVDERSIYERAESYELDGFNRPGVYEVRLEHRGFDLLGEPRVFLLDRTQVTVVDEVWRGPTTVRPGAVRPSDLEPPSYAPLFPPIGLPGSCGDRSWLPPPEDVVELRLVHNVRGRYEPVEGPLRYGDDFYVEARVATMPRRALYGIRFAMGGVDERPGTVTVRPTEDDPRLLRSSVLYMLWPLDGEVSR